MVYEPLYHAREIATTKWSSSCSCKAKSVRSIDLSIFFLFSQNLSPIGNRKVSFAHLEEEELKKKKKRKGFRRLLLKQS